MKRIYGRFIAIPISVLTALSSLHYFSALADTKDISENKQVTVHFDISGEGVEFDKDIDGNILEIKDITADVNSSVRLPEHYLVRKGYSFSGWTDDGVRGYPMDSVFQVGEEDVTLTPVWSDLNNKTSYNIEYKVEIDGEDTELPLTLQNLKQFPGTLVKVSLLAFDYPQNTYAQIGWIYDGNTYLGQQCIIMPEHDIVLTPNWLKYYKLKYTAGDVDRLNGATSGEFDRLEKQDTGLAEAGRFSRNGFKIIGWSCDADGQVYAPLSNYMMPSQDVTFTAVWEPITYNILFMGNTGKADDIIKIEGKTDTAIICPEFTGTKTGYYFDGWKFEEKINGVTQTAIYQPGDEFIIKGAKPGMGIYLSAVWKEGTPPSPEIICGDANCNGEVRLNDAVLIMQSIGNPDVYGLEGSAPTAITERGILNADCYNRGDGLTNMDALAIQKYLINIFKELPVKE